MRRIVLLLAALLQPVSSAHAQSEVDRLRDALRTAQTQAKAAEDQRAALQAKQAEGERERERLRKQTEALRKQVKETEDSHRQAVEEFNQRLEERNETLEKWKAAYAEAATVARTKDAERAKFESEAGTYRANAKSCATRNVALAKVGQDLLMRYEELTIGDMMIAREPLTGLMRVNIQNFLQDQQDKILEQRIERAEQRQKAEQIAAQKQKPGPTEQKAKP
jgi:hypothetical protein